MRIFALLLALALPLLSSCAEPVAVLPIGPAQPPMWVIHDADTRIVLLGSVHQLPPDLAWTGGRLATELQLADELLLELAPAESDAAGTMFAAQSHNEPVPTVTARFGGESEAVLDLISDIGMDEAEADRTESWAIALAAGNALSRRNGLSAAHGVEAVTTANFRGRGLSVGGLETARQQLDMFDNLSPTQQDQLVLATLAGMADNHARTRRLLNGWAAGDLDALSAAAAEAMAETPFLIEPVIHARNRAWAAALLRRLEQPGDVMLVVGVGHLVGEASLLDALRSRGVRPMRLQ